MDNNTLQIYVRFGKLRLQICTVKPRDTATIRSTELLVRLGIEDLDLILKERRLSWYGHVEYSSGAVKTAIDIQVDGKRGPGRLVPGRGPLLWILPLYLHVNQNSDDDDSLTQYLYQQPGWYMESI